MTTSQRTLPNGATITVHEIDGADYTDHEGLQAITGRARARLRTLEADNDTGFPPAITAPRAGRGRAPKLYPIAAAEAYRQRLDAATGRTIKPGHGDPADLLDLHAVRELWSAAAPAPLTIATMRRYANRSRDAWTSGEPGILPIPDAGYDPEHPHDSSPKHWYWRRSTITAHGRAGRGAPGRARTAGD